MKNIGLLFLVLCLSACGAQTPNPEEKINGVSFVASREAIDKNHVAPVVRLGANYAAVMPFGFIRDAKTPEIRYDTDRQWFGETREGIRQYISHLHDQQIKVMIKPHLWLWKGQFTGYLKMENEADWVALENAYRKFILNYASLAQETAVSLFAIGTELEQFVVNRPDFWNTLIQDIRKVYTGKLTYASNWDEYSRVPFWEALDLIGIDGYFPVATEVTPTVASTIEGWAPWKKELAAFAKANKRQIVFTEFGYRSVDYAAKEPWTTDHTIESVNLEAQANALQGTFESLWKEDWFAGGFVWKWFINHDTAGGLENNRFTPQNKPAEAVIRSYYTLPK